MNSSTISAAAVAHSPSSNWTILKRYPAADHTHHLNIVLVRGSVLEFAATTSGAIVNAANEGCLGGGGVDGAITSAGGPALAADRRALPILEGPNTDDSDSDDDDSMGGYVRCRTGSAVLTGPGEYGDLQVPYVIHAVGPNFHFVPSAQHGVRLLQSAYSTALDVAAESRVITDVAFSLLSAGVFRGSMKLSEILLYSLESIGKWKPRQGGSKVETVYVCGFTRQECSMLVKVADYLWPDSAGNEEDDSEDTPRESSDARNSNDPSTSRPDLKSKEDPPSQSQTNAKAPTEADKQAEHLEL